MNSLIRFLLIVPFLLLLLTLWGSCKREPKTIDNIETFARLYGYVRFFHPSDEAARIDWNRFAMYGVRQVENALDSGELAEILTGLFQPLCPGLVIYEEGEKQEFDPATVTPPQTRGMRPVSWQHYGVSLNDGSFGYESIRLNRIKLIHSGSRNATLISALPAGNLQGREYIFRASVKTIQGVVRLTCQTVSEGSRSVLIHPPEPPPINSPEWSVHEISGVIPRDAVTFQMGISLEGSGPVYIDDVGLFVKEGNQFKPLDSNNMGFESYADGDTPFAWMMDGFGYGFAVSSETAASGVRSLMISGKVMEGPIRLFEEEAIFGEYIDKPLGGGLSCFIPLVLYGDDRHTWPVAPSADFERLSERLKAAYPGDLSVLSPTSPDVCCGGVIIAWNVFQHFYPNFDHSGDLWRAVLTRALREAWVADDPKVYWGVLKTMIAALNDGQAYVRYWELEKELAGLPILLDWVENSIVVVASGDTRVEPGDIVVSLDGKPAERVLTDLERTVSGFRPAKLYRALGLFIRGLERHGALLTLRRGKRMLDVPLIFYNKAPIPEYRREPLLQARDNVFYVDVAAIPIELFREHVRELSKADAVIFDCRGNVDYLKKEILGHLIDQPVFSPIFHIPHIIYPDRERLVMEDEKWTIRPAAPRFRGRALFIADSRVGGAAEIILSISAFYGLGDIVGQATPGVLGQINSFVLPGGFEVFWTGVKTLRQDRSEILHTGIAPSVQVQRSFQGIMAGRDELLESALSLLNGR